MRSDDSPTSGVVAVLLAAGRGTRFDGATHKLLAELPATGDRPAEPVVARSLARIVDAADHATPHARFDAIVIVTGAADLTDTVAGARRRDRVHPEGDGVPIVLVRNERWADGQATSIQEGIAAADRLGADIAVIGLADQPGVAADTWRAVAEAAAGADAAPITVATYDGSPRNPVALHRSVWQLLPTEGDSGARELVRTRHDLLRAVPSSGSAADIDTVEDLSRWLNS